MIDLHSHILPGIDDGASDLEISLEMARMQVADGVTIQACTPHILPGMYHNTGPDIRRAVSELQAALAEYEIPLQLVAGADNHMIPDFVNQLRSGHLLGLAGSRYVLVEPPHHVAPPQVEAFFFGLLVAGYVPVLTHPERLSWINTHYEVFKQLVHKGVWMQITSGSLTGDFGDGARYWGERMLDEGCAHILATDAHGTKRRAPHLSKGRDVAAERVGAEEATHLVETRPQAVISDLAPAEVPAPRAQDERRDFDAGSALEREADRTPVHAGRGAGRDHLSFSGIRHFADRLRRFLD
jgi:protein-tyrosine phosphatase